MTWLKLPRQDLCPYQFNALGRRVQRIVATRREKTKFVYDGDDVLVDDNNGVLTKYINGPGVDNKLKMTTNGTVRYFIADHLGLVNTLTARSVSVVWPEPRMRRQSLAQCVSAGKDSHQ